MLLVRRLALPGLAWHDQTMAVAGLTGDSRHASPEPPRTLADLLAHPDVVEESFLHGTFGFMAFHGGALEEMTDVIARRAAEAAGGSYYGVLQPESLLLHLPSIRFTVDQSPVLAAFLGHVDVVITVHGFGRRRMPASLLLGGRNRALAQHLAGHLRAALPDYDVIDELGGIPTELQGIHRSNPVNVPRFGGVQLELPPRLRRAGDATTEVVVEALATAAHRWSTEADEPLPTPG